MGDVIELTVRVTNLEKTVVKQQEEIDFLKNENGELKAEIASLNGKVTDLMKSIALVVRKYDELEKSTGAAKYSQDENVVLASSEDVPSTSTTSEKESEDIDETL